MEEYKVKWELINGTCHVSDWMTKKDARKKFESLKQDLNNNVVWCELLYASLDENATDEVLLVDDFENKVVSIMGHKMIV